MKFNMTNAILWWQCSLYIHEMSLFFKWQLQIRTCALCFLDSLAKVAFMGGETVLIKQKPDMKLKKEFRGCCYVLAKIFLHFLALYLETATVFNTCTLIYRERPNTWNGFKHLWKEMQHVLLGLWENPNFHSGRLIPSMSASRFDIHQPELFKEKWKNSVLFSCGVICPQLGTILPDFYNIIYPSPTQLDCNYAIAPKEYTATQVSRMYF